MSSLCANEHAVRAGGSNRHRRGACRCNHGGYLLATVPLGLASNRGARCDFGGPMKRSLYAMAGVAGVSLLAAACGSSAGGYATGAAPPTTGAPAAPSATAAPTATATTVALANSKLGQILVDSA